MSKGDVERSVTDFVVRLAKDVDWTVVLTNGRADERVAKGDESL